MLLSSNLNRIGLKSSCHPSTFSHCSVFRVPLVLTSGSFLYGRTAIYPGLPRGSSVFVFDFVFLFYLVTGIINSAPFHSQKGPSFRDIVYTDTS